MNLRELFWIDNLSSFNTKWNEEPIALLKKKVVEVMNEIRHIIALLDTLWVSYPER